MVNGFCSGESVSLYLKELPAGGFGIAKDRSSPDRDERNGFEVGSFVPDGTHGARLTLPSVKTLGYFHEDGSDACLYR